MIKRFWWVFALAGCVVVVFGLGAVFVHDSNCQIERWNLCGRADGSEWRDSSGRCGAENDPRCGAGGSCADSEVLKPGTDESCAWIF